MAKRLDINPWFTMWYKPRETVRKIVKYNPKYLVLPLAMIGGFAQVIDRAAVRSLGDQLSVSTIFIFALVGGPLLGILSLYVFSALLRWTGKWIGGKASSEHIRTALAWSIVPSVWALILLVPELALFGKELFTSITPKIDSSLTLIALLFLFGAIEIGIGIWSFIISLKSIGEVQGFSAWKALLNSVLSGLVIVIPVIVLVLIGLILSIA